MNSAAESQSRNQTLRNRDPEVASWLQREDRRQATTLTLIASETHCSAAVREASQSRITDKYAEGYPGKRYYGGCEVVDKVEQLAIDRAKQLFGADHANVQPHSGAQANFAAFMALAKPGETIMGLALPHGGHLARSLVRTDRFRPEPPACQVRTRLDRTTSVAAARPSPFGSR